MSIQLRRKEEIELMRRANMAVYEVLQILREMVLPGVTTAELDQRAKDECVRRGAVPAFLNYPSPSPDVAPFPGVICSSVNDVIVHGMSSNEPLKDGDILSIDFGCSIDGYFGDAALTVPVGNVSAKAAHLVDVTRQSLERAIEACIAGNRIGDISHAVQSLAEANGFGVVREFVGHGIGTRMHEPPHVPNFGQAGQGRQLKPGMVIAIEPMITEGSFETKILDDGWTAVTKDGSLAAHFEHTVAITTDKPYVLSRP
ncbi:MAG TPA: type I methionyl aminopeptidase [Oligoflexia bacterium]|nr:type I methionyl aminopeptidase [Oligoflexia bacterium]